MVGGSLIGNSTNPVVISAVTQVGLPASATNDLAIASLAVSGRVQYADILAGYNQQLQGVNGQASIGLVAVGKDWIASNLIAGASTSSGGNSVSADGNFGTSASVDLPMQSDPSNTKLLAEIASIMIVGAVLGTPFSVNSADAFGLVAQYIVSFSDGGTTFLLKAGAHNDDLAIGATGDVTLREV